MMKSGRPAEGMARRDKQEDVDFAVVYEGQAFRHRAEREEGVATRLYEGFLELPVWIVLVVLWTAGATLLGSCVLALYLLGSLLSILLL